MKNGPSLTTLALMLCVSLIACKKGNGTLAPNGSFSSFSFSTNDSTISFPVNQVFIQDVSSTHTTLITGQYADTSSKPGNISIRVIGDTTGSYRGDSLFVAYTGPDGAMYTNTTDSSNIVEIDKFPKTADGMVSGSFTVWVAKGSDTLRFTNGVFKAPYQD